jgi:hexulose-6-phosphate isomerase
MGGVGIASQQASLPTGFAADPSENSDIGRHIYKSLKWNMVKLAGTTREKFATLKELGYDGVELDSPGEVDTKEAVAACESTGLPIEGVVNSTHWRVRHSDPDPNVRMQAMANMREAMHFAQSVGAGSVLLVPGKVTDPENENHDQVWQRSIAAIAELTPLADQLGIQILIENVGNGFCETPELFAEYIDAIDHPRVGIHFDIGNHIRISPPAQWIGVLGKRIKKLDVKDRTTANERTLVGEGDANWPQVRVALQELGYRGWAAAEVPGGDKDRLADVLRRMNRVLGKSDGNPQSLSHPTHRVPGAG